MRTSLLATKHAATLLRFDKDAITVHGHDAAEDEWASEQLEAACDADGASIKVNSQYLSEGLALCGTRDDELVGIKVPAKGGRVLLFGKNVTYMVMGMAINEADKQRLAA